MDSQQFIYLLLFKKTHLNFLVVFGVFRVLTTQ
jgi:hypothetical protein